MMKKTIGGLQSKSQRLKFRCPKGHEWEEGGISHALVYTDDKGVAHYSGPNCGLCLVEFFRQFPAEEVK